MTSSDGITWTSRSAATGGRVAYGDGLFVAVSLSSVITSGEIGLAARVAAAAEAARVAAAAEAARVAAAAEAARVAAANAAAEAAKQQKELLEILSLVPELGKISFNIGETSKALTGNKCVKGKVIKYVYKGAKCPKGYVKK